MAHVIAWLLGQLGRVLDAAVGFTLAAILVRRWPWQRKP